MNIYNYGEYTFSLVVSGLEFKKATNRNIVPSLNKQKNMCKKFFDTGSYLYKKYKLHHRPERIFTVSISGTFNANGTFTPTIQKHFILFVSACAQKFSECFESVVVTTKIYNRVLTQFPT